MREKEKKYTVVFDPYDGPEYEFLTRWGEWCKDVPEDLLTFDSKEEAEDYADSLRDKYPDAFGDFNVVLAEKI